MIFKPELAAKVLAGEKTVTRRMPSENPRSPWWRERCAYQPGRAYAVQAGRGKPAIGYVYIFDPPRLIELDHLTDLGAKAEGFDSPAEFEATWAALHGGYDPSALVWRVPFRLIHPDDYPLWEGTRP